MTNENEYRQFTKGQKVRSVFGETLTVLSQDGCMVFVKECSMGHYHPSKLYPVAK